MRKITDENKLMLVSDLYEILKELAESGKGNSAFLAISITLPCSLAFNSDKNLHLI